MDPWYKVVIPRKEVREGRSFNPDEFAIALERVVAETTSADYEDYRNPVQFFSRTCFTRALTDHTSMVLRRLVGETSNTAPVLTLITQFGGGKTHTLTALYHLAKNGKKAVDYPGITPLLQETGLGEVPQTRVAVFVGNAWDPQDGRETPWIELARQLAGNDGIAVLGRAVRTTPPGTDALGRLFEVAGGSVLILCDEVLNFVNRHRGMAEPFHAFIQNLTVAMTGTRRSAAVLSLPRSQAEMTDWELQWQERITKVVRRVAKDLIVNDEAEISEVVRRRLFEDLGDERLRKRIARAFADWCFERRAQLPPEWTAVDTAITETKAREFLQTRFEVCYPFHPATLSVFQRKWQTLPQYQQTRGTLAMLAQWISWAYREGFTHARREPLITLGSAPLDVSEFRSIVLGQLGESRLVAAIDADIAGLQSHARAMDMDTKGALKAIHQRVGTTILFESSGGQVDKVAHLPEIRFALGEPEVDTTSIDNAAFALEAKAFYIRKLGSDGFQIRYQPTLKKVVSDRRAALDEDSEVRPIMREVVKAEFERGRSIPIHYFPSDNAAVPDSPKLMLVVMDPGIEWNGNGGLRTQIAEWTRQRGTSPRLYPGSLVWCLKKPGRELRDKVELWLAWRRVRREIDEGTLGGDFDRTEQAELRSKAVEAEEEARDEVWASYRFVVLADSQAADGLKTIDLGAGHSSTGETLCGRVIAALKSQALLNESPGAGYLERRWPPAFKDSGAWPLVSLRQAFLTGAMERLLDPDAYLRTRIPEFVVKGEFGLASGQKPDGTYERVWYAEPLDPEEVAFEADVFLLKKSKAQALKSGTGVVSETGTILDTGPQPVSEQERPAQPEPQPEPELAAVPQTKTIRLGGTVPPEMWNRLGIKLLPKLRSGDTLTVRVEFTATMSADLARNLISDLHQILEDLGVADQVRIDES